MSKEEQKIIDKLKGINQKEKWITLEAHECEGLTEQEIDDLENYGTAYLKASMGYPETQNRQVKMIGYIMLCLLLITVMVII